MPGIHGANNARNVQGGAQPPQEQGSFLGRVVSAVSSRVRAFLSIANEFHAEMSGLPIVGSDNLLNRTVDLPSYLQGLSFENLKEVAESVVQDLESDDQERNLQGAQVWGELLSLNLEGLHPNERQEILETLDVVKRLGEMSAGNVIEVVKGLLADGHTDELRDRGVDLLLSIANSEEVPLDQRILAAEGVCRYGRTDALRDKGAELLSGIGNRGFELLLTIASSEEVPFAQRISAAKGICRYSYTDELSIEGVDLLLRMATSEEVPLPERISAAKGLCRYGYTDELSLEGVDLLLRMASSEEVPFAQRISAAKGLCRYGHTDALKNRGAELLLRMVNSEEMPFDQRIPAAEGLCRYGRTDELRDKGAELLSDIGDRGVELLLSIADSEEAPFTQRISAAKGLCRYGRTDALRDKGAELLLRMAISEEAPFVQRIWAAEGLCRYGHTDELRDRGAELLLRMANTEAIPLSQRIPAAQCLCLYGRTDELRDKGVELLRGTRLNGLIGLGGKRVELLLRMATSEEVPFAQRLWAAEGLFRYGRTPELKNQAIERLNILLDSNISNDNENKHIVEKMCELVRLNFSAYRGGDVLKEKMLTFLFEKVLRNDAFAGDNVLLDSVSSTILDVLAGQEADPRFQGAQAIQFFLAAPDAVNNPYTIHRAANEKSHSLSEVDSGSLEALVPAGEGGYRLQGRYLQMVMPVPSEEDMPKASYEDLKELQEHLRAALATASLETKKLLLQTDDDTAVDHKIDIMLQSFDTAIGLGVVKGWMKPQVGGGFNRTAYELQFLVEMIHKELEAWQEAGGAHGQELSKPAANMYQLMVNMMTCPSGKQAGVRLSAQENGVSSPKSDALLKGQLSSQVQGALDSQEEGFLALQSTIMDFVGDAYDIFQGFKSNLLDGDSDFIKKMTESDLVSQPSHQRDYAFLVLGKSLGLMVEGEAVPVDLHAGTIHERLRNASGEDLLKACLEQSVGGNNITDALIATFAKHWFEEIEAGANQSNPSKEAGEKYGDFIKFVGVIGLNAVDVFDFDEVEDEDGDFNTVLTALKPQAVAVMLEHLGILKKPD